MFERVLNTPLHKTYVNLRLLWKVTVNSYFLPPKRFEESSSWHWPWKNVTHGKAIYKTRNTGMGNEMRGMQGTRVIFTRIPGNLLVDSVECYRFNILVNVQEESGVVVVDSMECSKRFWRVFEKNIQIKMKNV